MCYFYPRSPCGERRLFHFQHLLHTIISIHALLAESDNARHGPAAFAAISIHALLAESDAKRLMQQDLTIKFLSTLSLRRATLAPKQNATEQRNFYPRSPCGERPSDQSIASGQYLFLSTLSLRRATIRHKMRRQSPSISIHALLAESDQSASYNAVLAESISIHALLAESDCCVGFCLGAKAEFLSTLSLRRATLMKFNWNSIRSFLSTLSLRRAT